MLSYRGGIKNARCSVIPTPTVTTRRDNTPPARRTTTGTTPTLRGTTLAAARTRLPAPSGAITPTTRVPRVVRHINSPPPPLKDLLSQHSPLQAPQPSLPPLRTTQACASDPHGTVATRTRVSQATSARIDLSMVNSTLRLHRQHHTRSCRLPLKMLARNISQESPTPLSRPTFFTPPTPPRPTFNINHSTKGWLPCSSGWFEVWAGGGGHVELFHDVPVSVPPRCTTLRHACHWRNFGGSCQSRGRQANSS